jgi:hypothetical protein
MKKEIDLIAIMVKKEFDIVGGDFEKEVKRKNWFTKRKFTSSQKETWKKFCIALIMKHLKCGKRKAEKEFLWLDFEYGFTDEKEKSAL